MGRRILLWISAAFLLVILFSGCAGTQREPDYDAAEASEKENVSPVEVFQDELETVLEEPLTDNGSDGAKLDEEILKLVKYEIKADDEHTAKVLIKAPDMRAIIIKDGDNLLKYEDGIQRIISALREEKIPMITTIVPVILDEDGMPQETYDLQDAMYGGLFTVLEEMMGYEEAGE